MIVSSGLKTVVTVTSVGAIRAKDGSYRNVAACDSVIRTKDNGYCNVAEFIVAVQDIAAVCRSHC